MRIWLSGPRLFGGLVRPGLSFGASDMRRIRVVMESPAPLPLLARVVMWAMLFGIGVFLSLFAAFILFAYHVI